MKKKVLSIVLAFVLTLSVSIAASAAAYPDLERHWAKEYMEELANRGYLTGYENGTMRPDKSITACEALALLSRLYALSDEARELIVGDFGLSVSEIAPSSLSWANDELSICLAAGIITESELRASDLSAAIEKERLSVYLVRAMQLVPEAESLAGTKLSFNDAAEISAENTGYIAQLVKAGIVTGDNNNNFSPRMSVTRAVAAAMISRSLQYLKSIDKTPAIEAYGGVTSAEGIIAAVGGGNLELGCFDGLTRVYSVPAAAKVFVNGVEKSLSSAYKNCFARLVMKSGAVVRLYIESEPDTDWVQGKISGVSSTSTANAIYVTELRSGTQTKYSIPSDAKLSYEGKAISFSSLERNSFVTLKIEDERVTEVLAASGDCELRGDISEIRYGTTVTFKITDTYGVEYCFLLDISSLPEILRGDMSISIDRLNIGDQVTVSLESCSVASIVAEGSENTLTGELMTIILSTDATKWVLALDDGTHATLTVDENAGVYAGNTAILLSDVHAGDRVSVVVYGNTITEVYLEGGMTSTSKVSGTVLAVDTRTKTATVLTSSGKLVYVDMSSAVSIINAATGKSLGISSIAANDGLVAYGSYNNSTTFRAVSVIVEG